MEIERAHAEFAAREFERAGVAAKIDQRMGPALEVLPGLADELGPGSVDVVFLDAVKTEYSAYFDILGPMIRPGGLLLADNVLGSSSWWIDNPGAGEDVGAIDAFNRRIAADPGFESVAVPVRQGVLIARKVG